MRSLFLLKKTAFTLAEVLITLAIIGVVVAMTMPSVVNNVRESNYKAHLKKVIPKFQKIWIL